jgi:hypothetical protein
MACLVDEIGVGELCNTFQTSNNRFRFRLHQWPSAKFGCSTTIGNNIQTAPGMLEHDHLLDEANIPKTHMGSFKGLPVREQYGLIQRAGSVRHKPDINQSTNEHNRQAPCQVYIYI